MNNISIIANCANCGACTNACPVEAITIADGYFYKANVNTDKCILCGKCVDVCPMNNEINGFHPIKAICGWASDAEIRQQSSSGGVFSLLAECVLSNNGVVFGACFSEDKKSVIIDSTDHFPLDELRRSKYVESSTGEAFYAVRENLKKGRQVLFCGTPCQVAGLSFFLGKDYENLILCDFACGGLPSHQLYQEYISQQEKKQHSKVVSVNFRSKSMGWSKYYISLLHENGKKHGRLAITDPYFYSFLYARVSIRDNCYECKFANHHYSDITLSDYWKYKETPEIINDEKGISLVVANTLKGVAALDKIAVKMQCYELELKKAVYNYMDTVSNSALRKRRQVFFSELESNGLLEAAKKCGMPSGLKSVILLIKGRVKYAINPNKNK